MKFDWRYAFHAFWLYLTFMILFSTAYYFNQGHSLRMAVGTIVALLVVDGLFTRNYPYFNRVNRQGALALIDLAFFALLVLLAMNFNPDWPQAIWNAMSFFLAGMGGTVDGCVAHKTRILPYQTRRDLIRKAEIQGKPIER
ncbi:hypothetical protein [Levilactobacillus zymae]|uniref:hypothetical protein n=1 Tax=Levilactobacillus zymae TaxID=267363 RepID=UPI0028B4B721|nr:hypothetical protein [Levilactobacillus zymae]MDT6979758.1 hypothetical protein [Levilactobacillus zymae]